MKFISLLKTIIYLHIIFSLTSKDINSMYIGETKAEIPLYCCFKGTPITNNTIGDLALQNTLPEEELNLVKEWRDTHKGLLQTLVDFSYPNAQWRGRFNECNQLLSKHGLNNKSKSSFIFESIKRFFIQIAARNTEWAM